MTVYQQTILDDGTIGEIRYTELPLEDRRVVTRSKSEAMKAKWANPDNRKKQSDALKEAWNNPKTKLGTEEWRQKNAAATKAAWENGSYDDVLHTEDWKQKVSDAQRGQPACGTRNGYAWHARHEGVPINCSECLEAIRRYGRNKKNQKRELVAEFCGVSAETRCMNPSCATPECSTPHVDHVKPVSKGGTDTLDNKQILCAKCNFTKSDSVDPRWDFRPLYLSNE